MNAAPKAKQQTRHGAAGRDDVNQYGALVWRGIGPKPRKLWFETPVDALMCSIEYLKVGYQCRLTNGAVVAFAEAAKSGPNGDGHANVEELMRQRILAELADLPAHERAHVLSLARHPSGRADA